MASPHPFSEKIVSSNYVSIWLWWKWVMILIPRPAFKHNIPDFHLITIIRYLVIITCFLDFQFSQERQCNSLGAILKGQRREVLCVSTLPQLRRLCSLLLFCGEVAFPLYTSGNPLGQSEQNSQQRPNHRDPLKSMFSKTLHFWWNKMIWYLSIGSDKK